MLIARRRYRPLRASLLALLVLPFLLDAPYVFAGQPRTLPTVRLIATGGTISNRPGGRLTAEQLIASIPILDRFAVAEAEQFDNIASSMLTLDQWLELSRRVNELLSGRPNLTGIVVTTGTDTLKETAYFLHLTVRSEKPVVVVGSMRPPQSLSYDGAVAKARDLLPRDHLRGSARWSAKIAEHRRSVATPKVSDTRRDFRRCRQHAVLGGVRRSAHPFGNDSLRNAGGQATPRGRAFHALPWWLRLTLFPSDCSSLGLFQLTGSCLRAPVTVDTGDGRHRTHPATPARIRHGPE